MTGDSILLVDDEPRMRSSIEALLAGTGHAVATAASGVEALEMMGGRGWDLILLDMMLGDMTGYEVMDQAGRLEPQALVVIITGNASIPAAVEALRRGAYGYLKKPFEPEELENTVRNALATRRLAVEKKQVALALLESEKRFRHLVESSPVGILIAQDHRIAYGNPAAREILGPISTRTRVDRATCLHPEDRERIMGLYYRLASGQLPAADTDFRLSAGVSGAPGHRTARWLKVRAGAFAHRGRPALLLNLIDVTRAKEMERLAQVKSKMLSLGRVAAGLAHEIRNPLTGINSYLYTLRSLTEGGVPSGEDLELMLRILGQLQTASNKIETVIKRVLDFSKPSAPRLTNLDVNEVIRAAVNLTRVTTRKKGVHLTTALTEPLPPCPADAHLIEQVLINLIDNAAQALERTNGERIIEVASLAGAGRVAVTVADSGPGVDPELRAAIFDPFFTTKADGSGIGLAIVQRVVTDHRGTIEVGSGRLGGAEFKIELPIGIDVDPEAR